MNRRGTTNGLLPPTRTIEPGSERPYRPPPYLYGYAYQVAQALAEGRRIPSQRTLAPMLGISHKTLSAALLRDGAQAWLTDELRRHLGAEADVTARVLTLVAVTALQGNLEAAPDLLPGRRSGRRTAGGVRWPWQRGLERHHAG